MCVVQPKDPHVAAGLVKLFFRGEFCICVYVIV